MPRCHSCGTYVKNPHREVDGRTERAYCDLCSAERDWKFNDEYEMKVEMPPMDWWSRLKRFLRF